MAGDKEAGEVGTGRGGEDCAGEGLVDGEVGGVSYGRQAELYGAGAGLGFADLDVGFVTVGAGVVGVAVGSVQVGERGSGGDGQGLGSCPGGCMQEGDAPFGGESYGVLQGERIFRGEAEVCEESLIRRDVKTGFSGF